MQPAYMRSVSFWGKLTAAVFAPAVAKLLSLQTGSLYEIFCFRIARGRARGGEPAMVLVRSEYLRSDSNVNCWLANSTWHMSNKKAQTCSKTVLGYRRVAEECLFAQNWGKIFQRLKSGHLYGYRVIWDHLLAFKAEIIQKQTLFQFLCWTTCEE